MKTSQDLYLGAGGYLLQANARMQRDASKRAADQAVESTPPKKKQQKPALSDNIKSAEGDAFASLKITSFDGLIDKRVLCPGCNKSQKNYCCKCLKVLPGCSIPCLKLPIHLDIVHHVSFHRMIEIVSLDFQSSGFDVKCKVYDVKK